MPAMAIFGGSCSGLDGGGMSDIRFCLAGQWSVMAHEVRISGQATRVVYA